jgi:WXG100 family type VII secretion target
MAMDLKVSTSALTSEANELAKLKNELNTEITAMRSISARYLNMWRGESHDAFVNSVAKNMTLLSQFLKTVQDFSTALNEVAQIYEKSEKDAVRRATERN